MKDKNVTRTIISEYTRPWGWYPPLCHQWIPAPGSGVNLVFTEYVLVYKEFACGMGHGNYTTKYHIKLSLFGL